MQFTLKSSASEDHALFIEIHILQYFAQESCCETGGLLHDALLVISSVVLGFLVVDIPFLNPRGPFLNCPLLELPQVTWLQKTSIDNGMLEGGFKILAGKRTVLPS